MCGIAGIMAYHHAAPPVDAQELERIRDAMRARGPDGEGLWRAEDGRVGLAHRRLSIIDLSEAGAQPMAGAAGRLQISFNGEIYNYRALRRELEQQGARFSSESDTEVLLHLYERHGEGMFDKLRGMYAFALWDRERKAVLLARDPYGIKPLYYADDGWTCRFASQVRALLGSGRVSRDPDPAGWVGFMLFGSVPEPYTTHREIRALPAGSHLWVDQLGPGEPCRHFSIARCFAASAPEHSPAERAEAVARALRQSVADHLVADVPVGAFLSSGVDSGALLALASEQSECPTRTVTLGFEEFAGSTSDEAPLARAMAERYGAEHQTRRVTREEFMRELPGLMDAMDQPSIDGMNTFFVSKAARERGLKVALSGLGGDELFGGYSSFRDIPRWVGWMRVPSRVPGLGRAFRRGTTSVLQVVPKLSPKLSGMVSLGGSMSGAYLLRRGLFMPWELPGVMDPELAEEGLRRLDPVRYIEGRLDPMPQTDYGVVATLESSLYMRHQLLRDADWASMAHSLEVRTPLVDAHLLQQLAPLLVSPGQVNGKRLMAASPVRPLPNTVVDRPKTGFQTPIRRWLEQSDALGAWRDVASLRHRGCHWSRRLAYGVAQEWSP